MSTIPRKVVDVGAQVDVAERLLDRLAGRQVSQHADQEEQQQEGEGDDRGEELAPVIAEAKMPMARNRAPTQEQAQVAGNDRPPVHLLVIGDEPRVGQGRQPEEGVEDERRQVLAGTTWLSVTGAVISTSIEPVLSSSERSRIGSSVPSTMSTSVVERKKYSIGGPARDAGRSGPTPSRRR